MYLPEDIKKVALLGTLKQPWSPTPTPFNMLPSEEIPPEGQLLLEVCNLNMRAYAGYVPGSDHLPLPIVEPSGTTTCCSDLAMSHLRLMLSGVHQYVLKEWLITANRMNYHVREDVLPRLLLLGQKHEDMRPYLLSVIGERGMWLASEITNQNWGWVLETPQYNLDDVMEYERLQEYAIIERLRGEKLDVLRAEFSQWSKYRLVWSYELTEAFIASLERVEPPPHWSGTWWAEAMIRNIQPLAHFFPLDRVQQMCDRIKAAPAFSAKDGDISFEDFYMIWRFRQGMLDALNNGRTE